MSYRSQPTRRRLAAVLVASALCALSPLTSAQGDVSAAASAFSRAQEAEARGDPSRAASLYELADRISPAPASLRNATRARLAAGQLPAAAVNAEELKRRYPDDAASSALADDVLLEARQKLGRVSAQCAPECHLVLDGLAASTELKKAHVLYIEPGAHTIVARFESGQSATQSAEAKAGQPIQLQFVEPAAPAPTAAPLAAGPAAPVSPVAPPPAADQGAKTALPPLVGLAIGGAAVVVTGIAVWSAIDTQNAADDFKRNPTRDAFEDGEGKDTRTSVLIGAAAVLGVASAGVLIFATDWGDHGAQPAAGLKLRVVGSPRQTGLNLQGTF